MNRQRQTDGCSIVSKRTHEAGMSQGIPVSIATAHNEVVWLASHLAAGCTGGIPEIINLNLDSNQRPPA